MRTALESIVAVSGSAAFFALQKALEARGVQPFQSLPVGLVFGTVVNLAMRGLLLQLPLAHVVGRRALVLGSELEGLWLEDIDRRGQDHYSLFRFRYEPETSTYAMVGQSYFGNGELHSKWDTAPVMIQKRPGGYYVEYVYRARLSRGGDFERPGFGWSYFSRDPATDRVTCGNGSYLSVEEHPPTECGYNLHRIDSDFLKAVGWPSRRRLTSEMEKEDLVRTSHKWLRGGGRRLHSEPVQRSGLAGR